MWVPGDAAQIETAAKAGDLDETPSFDAKAALPTPKKNADLATDVAAMTTDGGVLLYGVAEDEHKRPTIPNPIPLAGVAERIDQIVSTSISEVPHIDVREYPCADDPSRGYVAVIVPQSARAPHQVIVGGDHRYYGRGAKGNRRLSEAEVARLYERRHSWSVDRDEVLAEVVASAPVPQRPGDGHVHAFARPVVLDEGMFERALEAVGGTQAMHQHLLNVVNKTTLRGQYGPSVEQAHHWVRRGADEWRLSNSTEADDFSAPNIVNGLCTVTVNVGGRGQHFCGRATDTRIGATEAPRIIEVVIAGNLEAFLAIMGSIYEVAGYHGHVDVGVALTGLKGAGSERRQRHLGRPLSYSAETFKRHARVAATELADAAGVAHTLLRQFYEATTGIDGYNPFTHSEHR